MMLTLKGQNQNLVLKATAYLRVPLPYCAHSAHPLYLALGWQGEGGSGLLGWDVSTVPH